VRTHHIPTRRHIQGTSTPIRLRFSASNLTDGAGLLLLRRLWDTLNLGEKIDSVSTGGRYCSSLLIEIWIALLWYGGTYLDDIKLIAARGIRRLFGWCAIPDPTTFGRWLRKAGLEMSRYLDDLLWWTVLQRWRRIGIPRSVMLVMDSTVVVRYGLKQAGAEKGYNPKKPGRPSHHPMVAFLAGRGDCLGVRWRPGSAHAATGAEEWITLLVKRLYAAGVEEITIRMDKGFYSKKIVKGLNELDVQYLLKIPDQHWARAALGPWRASKKDPTIWTSSGTLWGTRLLSVEERNYEQCEDELALDTYTVKSRAHVLTNIPDIHALTAWRQYNSGAVVEQRIEELVQLGVGRTAVDDIGGNHLLWSLGALAYQLLHILRTTSLRGAWKSAQPHRLRAWLFRMPAKLTRHARKTYVQPSRDEPIRRKFLRALRRLGSLAPPAPA
jgi:hypothetical protein